MYASATGACSVKALAPLERLGLWGEGTAFDNFIDFEKRLSKAGTAALEPRTRAGQL